MRRAAVVLAFLVLWTLAGCEAPPSAPPPAAPPSPQTAPPAPTPGPGPPIKKNGGPDMANGGPRAAGRAFLVGSQAEGRGYALYSYLLLGGLPDDTTRDLYRAAVLAFLGKISELEKVEREFTPEQINVVYLPVERTPSVAPPYDAAVADRVLGDYNYVRAAALLRAVPRANRAGPYIVSYRVPISGIARLDRDYLFQDLSAVPADVVRFWVDLFLRRSTQERYWEEPRLDKLVLDLRTEIEKVAVTLPDIKDAVKVWVVWVK